MGPEAIRRGVVTGINEPDWSPLEAVVCGRMVAWFMWVHEVTLIGGPRLQAYKNVATRRYLHVTADHRAFVLRPDGRYQSIHLARALQLAFAGWEKAGPDIDDQRALRTALVSARGAPFSSPPR